MPGVNRHKKPSQAELVNRIYRMQLANHKAVMKQLTAIALDTAAALVTLTELNRLRVRQDVQTDRLIGLMKQFADRDRATRLKAAEADKFTAEPLRPFARWPDAGCAPPPNAPEPLAFTTGQWSAAPAPLAAVPTLETTR